LAEALVDGLATALAAVERTVDGEDWADVVGLGSSAGGFDGGAEDGGLEDGGSDGGVDGGGDVLRDGLGWTTIGGVGEAVAVLPGAVVVGAAVWPGAGTASKMRVAP
jgi:hypothetical protein